MFGTHLRATADKAQRVMGALGRLMPNVGGSSENRRRLFVSVVHSVLLYGPPTWVPSAFCDTRNVRVLALWASIRYASAYRTVSYDAVMVITRTPPHRPADPRTPRDGRGTQGVTEGGRGPTKSRRPPLPSRGFGQWPYRHGGFRI